MYGGQSMWVWLRQADRAAHGRDDAEARHSSACNAVSALEQRLKVRRPLDTLPVLAIAQQGTCTASSSRHCSMWHPPLQGLWRTILHPARLCHGVSPGCHTASMHCAGPGITLLREGMCLCRGSFVDSGTVESGAKWRMLSSTVRALQGQAEERRGLNRRLKDLEVRLSSLMSGKALEDEEHAARLKASLLRLTACGSRRTHALAACTRMLQARMQVACPTCPPCPGTCLGEVGRQHSCCLCWVKAGHA